MWLSALVLNKVPFPHQYVLEVVKANIFFYALFFFFFFKRPFSTEANNSKHISPELYPVSPIPFFKHILKLCTFLIDVEGIRFIASPFANPFSA